MSAPTGVEPAGPILEPYDTTPSEEEQDEVLAASNRVTTVEPPDAYRVLRLVRIEVG